jgi:BNR repeat-containing family member
MWVCSMSGFLVAAVLMSSPRASAAPKDVSITRIPIGPAYASDAVNTSIFRVNAVTTSGSRQFVTYYAPDGRVVVGERNLPGATWDLAVQSFKGNIHDSHNDVVLGISADGLLHLAYNHHDNPLHYRVSERPFDIRSFGDPRPMTGKDERRVTYPQFLNAPDGTLYFFYRDGASGNGSLCLNRYDMKSKSWQAVQHPLIDGQGKRNPYWWRPSIGTDGTIYLGWCWRDTPNAQTNHDLCFACSKDGGHTWLRSDGQSQSLPITAENAQVIDPIPTGSNLINQCSSAVDSQGHCHLVQYFDDDAGVPQYFDEWFDGQTWHKAQVSHRTVKFSLTGGGALAIPISRPEVAIAPDDTVYVITRDAEVGGGIRLYQASAPYHDWKTVDLTHSDLGNWEPMYDLNRFRDCGVLSLFVLPVEQGNHERTTNFGPHEAAIVEVPLK